MIVRPVSSNNGYPLWGIQSLWRVIYVQTSTTKIYTASLMPSLAVVQVRMDTLISHICVYFVVVVVGLTILYILQIFVHSEPPQYL